MSNTNRDYAIVYDVKNSSLVLSRALVFYTTDKNTSNIFVRLVTRITVGDGIDQYTDIENATNYILTMRVIKPNDEIKSIQAIQREPESIFQFDLTEGFKDIPGKYTCELMISTIVNGRQELTTSNQFNYEVKQSILSNVKIIETEGTTVEKLLNELDATKAELSSQIKENKNNIKILESKKYLLFGDSYAQGWTPDGDVVSWCLQLKNIMKIPDNDCYIFYHGGYGFVNGGFKILLDNSIASITDKENIKYIIVGGGYNDAKKYTQIEDPMKEFIVLAQQEYPNAEIIFAPFGWCVEGLTTDVHVDQKITNLVNMVLAYQKIAVENGCSYVDGIYSVLHANKFFSSDYVHPNSAGQYNIALALANYLKGGSFNQIQYMGSGNCFYGAILEPGITLDIQCHADVDGKTTTLTLLKGRISGDFTDIKLNGDSILLGKIASAAVHGYYNKISMKCFCILRKANGGYIEANMVLRISENKLYMEIVKLNENGSDFMTISFNRVDVYIRPEPLMINSLIN